MGNSGGVGVALEGVQAAVAALDSLDREDAVLAAGVGVGADVDVLHRRYEIRLERLELVARLEAQLAAVKAQDAADAVGFQEAVTPPDASVDDRTYAEMSVVEEIAGVLTVSSAAAGALVEQSRRICAQPLVLEALSAGTMSWQHARIVADETESLTAEDTASLVAHFFDPDAPQPARGAAPGELVPSRFRAKVRGWRERHHPESIEKRHVKGVADRRMEYTPDRDGMAWVSLYLPGDTACAIWNRTTATARGLQCPGEERTLTQLRPDIAASLLLGAGNALGGESGAGPAGVTVIGKVPAPRADVLVTVPVFALLGVTDEPAMLDGFGPIPASMARRLVAGGADSFYRVLVDPRDGAPLEIGRKNYRLTVPSNAGSGCAMPNARSPAAPTALPTTKQTTSKRGNTAAPPTSATWHSSAPNTTDSSTTANGSPARPPRMSRQAGPHPQGATTTPNSRTQNQPAGRNGCRLRSAAPRNAKPQ